MSRNRSQILTTARQVSSLWEGNSRIVTRPLQVALDDLLTLTGTEEYPSPEKVIYMILKEDWGTWLVQAANEEDARSQYLADRPGEGYRGIFRDTQTPVWIPKPDGAEGEDEA